MLRAARYDTRYEWCGDARYERYDDVMRSERSEARQEH